MTNRRAGVYCRISQDVAGEALGVARQEADCRTFITARDWTLITVEVDNDTSAFKGRRRVGYERLLDEVRAGNVDTVVAWHPDRLHRSPRELEDFIELIEQTGCLVVTVTAGERDFATPEGRLMARIEGAVARKESEDKSRRARRKHLELAERGRVGGGGNRPFGFERDRATHRPGEAELVREAARRVLAGESLWAIVRDWTARGVPTSTGAPWSTTAIRSFLVAPRVAGLRAHRGEVVCDAVWDPILERDQWDQVRAVLDARSRRRVRPARQYLLGGGLAVCGIEGCGAPLVASPRPYGRAYACLRSHGGCNGVSVKADPFEELVGDELAVAVATRGLLDAARSQTPVGVVDQVAVEESKLSEYARMWDAGEITRGEWLVLRDAATARLDEARVLTAESVRPFALEGLDADGFGGEWAAMTFGRRRAVLEAVLVDVAVRPVGPSGPKFDPSRVIPRWRW